MLLHTVSKSPQSSNALQSCLRSAAPGSRLLLLEDGVYAARNGTDSAARLAGRSDISCYVLLADALSRGIREQLAPGITAVEYTDFVRLSVECHAVQSWY